MNPNLPTTRMHLSLGVFCFSILALGQALIESVVLMIRFHGHIFRPQDILRVQILSLFHWVLDLSKYASLPVILDSYLGPHHRDMFPLIPRLLGVYEVAGLIAGFLFALMFSLLFKIRKRSVTHTNLLGFYFCIAFCFGVSFNLFSALIPTEVNDSFPVFNFVTGLLVAILFLVLLPMRFISLPSGIHFSNRWTNIALFLPIIAGLCFVLAMIANFPRAGTVIQPLYASSPNVRESKTKPPSKRTNVVLISIDSLRPDHLRSYGYRRNTSPNIDNLAKDGVLFKDAFSVTTWTLPAHMSMLTSLYPEAIGVVTYEDFLSEDHLSIAEILKHNGFETAGFVSGRYVNSYYGFDQGFSLYDDFSIDTDEGNAEVAATSQKLNVLIERWLNERPQKEFFLFLHYFDVHYDYIAPPPYDTLFDPDYKGSIDGRGYQLNPAVTKRMDPRDLEHIIALYDGEIAFTDDYIGRFISKLKNLGLYDETLIIVTSDHGEAFFEHGIKGHSSTPYEELIRVPLIIKFPASADFPRGTTFSGQASILDIMPTILDLLGLKSARQLDGQSLLPVMSGSTVLDNRTLYFVFERTQYAVRTDTRKLIQQIDETFSSPTSNRNMLEQFIKRYGRPSKEFYDLASDQKEKTNLAQKQKRKYRKEIDRQQRSLFDWLNHQRKSYYSVPQRGKRIEDSGEEAREKLRALGYFQ